jgi:uncharacterized membrane protein YedE/YeeE
MLAFLATLVIGLVLGYLGQRSRFCAVSGFRDWFLIRNTRLLKGYGALLLGGALGFALFKLIGANISNYPLGMDIGSVGGAIVIAIAGIGMGYFSTLADGCPFRQHVSAATGSKTSLFYLLGFYIGIVYFFLVTTNMVSILSKLIT